MQTSLRLSLATAVAGAALLSAAPRAQACGGFFCSQTPVDQTGEQIIFSVKKDHVTAQILINYQGEAKDFAWVLPVMVKPKITLGSAAVFRIVQQRTQPQFRIDWKFPSGSMCGGQPESAAASPTGARGGDDGVNVVDMRDVGPFSTVVLESKDTSALIAWLGENGYDQPPEARGLIQHYVTNGFLFVALKLKKDASVGEIQPIVLDMDHGEPCVPLILTRIAATKDMPVFAYVLGNGRAVPRNWFHVEVNQKKIDWLNNGSNYRAVVTSAINEAAGRGFVTEYAGPDDDLMRNAIYREGQWDLNRLRTLSDPVALVEAALRSGLPFDSTMQAILRKHVPMPPSVRALNVTEVTFYRSIRQYQSHLAGVRVDAAAFVADIEERIVTPLREAQKMFDEQPWMTRLFATVSPDEMTRDPLFQFNPELAPVSNIHMAKGTGTCGSNGVMTNVSLELETGETLSLPGPASRFPRAPVPGAQPWQGGAGEPSARTIALVGTTGQPTVYPQAQVQEIDRALDRETPEAVRLRPPLTVPAAAASNGCQLGGRPAGGALFGLLALGFALTRRRR